MTKKRAQIPKSVKNLFYQKNVTEAGLTFILILLAGNSCRMGVDFCLLLQPLCIEEGQTLVMKLSKSDLDFSGVIIFQCKI